VELPQGKEIINLPQHSLKKRRTAAQTSGYL
jgi:hypothetical protein